MRPLILSLSKDAPTIADLDRALALAATIVLTYGPAYAPTMERLKAERDALRASGTAEDRARRILADLPCSPPPCGEGLGVGVGE